MVTIIKSKSKLYWLLVNAIMIILMVSIGVITRLTDSGLSMTEWSLIGGILHPTNYESWLLLFDKYKLSPEFKIKNYNMTLSEFKNIFFWEYFHRIWGRLIGVIFFVSFILFWIFKRFSFLTSNVPFIISFKALTPESSYANSLNLYSSLSLAASNFYLSSLDKYLSNKISLSSTFKIFSASSK